MHEALKAAIEYGFKNLKLNSIAAYTKEDNLRSINLLINNSFIEETKKNDSFSDEKIFKLINKEI